MGEGDDETWTLALKGGMVRSPRAIPWSVFKFDGYKQS